MTPPRPRVHLGVRGTILVATAAATVIALSILYVTIAQVGGHSELARQQGENHAVAELLASEAKSGFDTSTLAAARRLLDQEHMRATIAMGGSVTHIGRPLDKGASLAVVRVPIEDGGTVTVTGEVDPLPSPPFLVVALATGVLVVVLGVAVATNVLVTRETRRRVTLAIDAAGQISSGDLSARLGEEGPEPLRSLGRAFDHMAQRLSESDATQRELLADLAHEIATPVHALSGYANAVLDGTVEPDRARTAIESQTQRLSTLLDELAELRLLGDERPLELERVELHLLVAQLLTDLSDSSAHLSVRPHLGSAAVRSDPHLVRTVVQNLLTNAFRFTPDGGTVDVTTRRSGQRAVVSVKDTGPGIAPEHQRRVFDRFYRVDASRDRADGGSGLGLSIAQRAALRMGGHIELDSTPGEGAELRLVLPLGGPPRAPGASSVSGAPKEGHRDATPP